MRSADSGTMTPQAALKAMGYNLNHPCNGSIIVSQGPAKVKRYAFRYRVGDGRIMTRRGRAVAAKHCGDGVYVFTVQS